MCLLISKISLKFKFKIEKGNYSLLIYALLWFIWNTKVFYTRIKTLLYFDYLFI